MEMPEAMYPMTALTRGVCGAHRSRRKIFPAPRRNRMDSATPEPGSVVADGTTPGRVPLT
ncbi:hypothetical protein JCM18897A_24760 [Streptomyces sp. JCM 18897]|uniref:Uncharacterized protein n=1 Tax=Streptomyces albidoflavus TaxID=1886 RepID=A0AA37BZE8_9ACTN|nr:hypothetical protein ScoT_38360 [Streptomyces albidoflavus]